MSQDQKTILADKLAEAISTVLPAVMKREKERIVQARDQKQKLEGKVGEPRDIPPSGCH